MGASDVIVMVILEKKNVLKKVNHRQTNLAAQAIN